MAPVEVDRKVFVNNRVTENNLPVKQQNPSIHRMQENKTIEMNAERAVIREVIVEKPIDVYIERPVPVYRDVEVPYDVIVERPREVIT